MLQFKSKQVLEKQRMTQEAPSMQYKFYISFYWGIIDPRRTVLYGSSGPNKPMQAITRVIAIHQSFEFGQIFSFTMLISKGSSTQLKNLHGQKCTIIPFSTKFSLSYFYIIESFKFKVLDFNLFPKKNNFTFKIVFLKILTSIQL